MAHISTANVTRRKGDPTNAAAGGLAIPSQVQAPVRAKRRRSVGNTAGATTAAAAEAIPIPNFGTTVQPGFQPGQRGAGGATSFQQLIDQVAANTNSGQTTEQFIPGDFRSDPRLTNLDRFDVGGGGMFTPDKRIEQLLRDLQNQGPSAQFTDTTGAQRQQLEALIKLMTSGEFNFDAGNDAESKAFRVAAERQREQAQIGLSERLAASPADSGNFASDTASLQERTGESVGRFSAGRASQRRAEVFNERSAGVNAGFSNLTQLGNQDISRFNADVGNANASMEARINALNARLQREGGRRSDFQQNENRRRGVFESDRDALIRQDALQRNSFANQQGLESSAFENQRRARERLDERGRFDSGQASEQAFIAEQNRLDREQHDKRAGEFENRERLARELALSDRATSEQDRLQSRNDRLLAEGRGDVGQGGGGAENQLLALLSGQGRSAPGIDQEAASRERAALQAQGQLGARNEFLQNEELARQRQADQAATVQAERDEQFRRRRQRSLERQQRALRRQAQATARSNALKRQRENAGQASNVQF